MWGDYMSIRYFLFKHLITLLPITHLSEMSTSEFIKYCNTKLSHQKYKAPKFIFNNFTVTEHLFNNHLCYEIKPCSDSERSKNTTIYIHGGAYILEMGYLNWMAVSEIIKDTGNTVFVPIYPLCPEHNYKETFDMLEKMYSYILMNNSTQNISVMGESAGAQISLSLCQYISEMQLAKPEKIILISPPLQMQPDEKTVNQMKSLESKDCMLKYNIFNLMAPPWIKGTTPENYLVSPIYGDFSGLGDIYLFIGTDEIMYPFADMLIKKAEENNKQIYYYEGKGMMHTWPFFTFTPEGKKSLNTIINILK